MIKGDIVLITFPFTDLSGNKLRPAVILIETKLDITACFITSQLAWQEPTDIIILPGSENGLKTLSLIRTSKIATIDRQLVKGILGMLNKSELLELDKKLKILLNL